MAENSLTIKAVATVSREKQQHLGSEHQASSSRGIFPSRLSLVFALLECSCNSLALLDSTACAPAPAAEEAEAERFSIAPTYPLQPRCVGRCQWLCR